MNLSSHLANCTFNFPNILRRMMSAYTACDGLQILVVAVRSTSINLPICAEDLGRAEKLSALHFEQIFVLSVCNAELIHSFSLLSMTRLFHRAGARGAIEEGVARAQTECVVMMTTGLCCCYLCSVQTRGGSRKCNGRH